MDMPNEFRPRLSDPSLVFTLEGKGSIVNLKWGIRQVLARYHPLSAALFMTQSLNYNHLRSRDRGERVILVTADSSPLADCLIVHLYVLLLQSNSEIATARAKYTVTVHGDVDCNMVSALSHHYFWMSSAFKQNPDSSGERYLLN